MKKFAINPPCRRPTLAASQVVDPTSVRRGEEFPKEWAKRQAKLQKTAAEAVRKFNEDSQATATKASASKAAPKKAILKKSTREIRDLSDEFDRYHADWLGAKVRFVKIAKNLNADVIASLPQQIPQAEASAQQGDENENTTDENQAAEEATRAAKEIPAPEEYARATTNVAPEEQPRPAKESVLSEETENARATASVVPEETAPTSSAPPAKYSKVKKITLPSASEVKKTKATEKEAARKRKASTSAESSAPKKELIPFGKEYVIPDDIDEDNPSTASSEQLDEEIEVEEAISTPLASSPVPQFTTEQTEEILTWSEGRQTSLQSIPEETPASIAKELKNQTAADETAPSIPQSEVPEVVTQEVVRLSTANLQPKPQNSHAKRPKFKADDFGEDHFFTDLNPYDSARLKHKRFWTASQMNFYASVLFDKDMVFSTVKFLMWTWSPLLSSNLF
nr:fibrous sheath CABYR-binding protein-like [Aegilops tauschii subsp. strangulata]